MDNKPDEKRIDLQRAKAIGENIVKKLQPHCEKIEIAGSIRRKRPWVHDIDLVIIPKDLWRVHSELMRLGTMRMSGTKLLRIKNDQIPIDVYFANPETWATLLLIRTGSAQNNIRLASIAKAKGWHLHANGDGLKDEEGNLLGGESERSIYEALELPWQEPEEREVRW